MKRFKFNLEKILELRSHLEQEAKNELGRAISALNVIENNIKNNFLSRMQAAQQRFSDLNDAENSGNSEGYKNAASSMIAWESYIVRLELEADRLMEEREAAEAVVEEKRQLYLEASRELKVLEKLKEKRHKEYRKETFAEETKELDDMFKAKK